MDRNPAAETLQKDLPEKRSPRGERNIAISTARRYSSRKDDPLAKTMRFLLDARPRLQGVSPVKKHPIAIKLSLLLSLSLVVAILCGLHARYDARARRAACFRANLEKLSCLEPFLDASKARVQVTAYALTEDFGPDPVFSNNSPARNAYAVPKHTLPAGNILNVALSPVVEQKLHAHLNDTIVLISRNRAHMHLATFVDRTAQTETRPVVDILFADAHEARIWGRRSFYAVDISQPGSPFQQ